MKTLWPGNIARLKAPPSRWLMLAAFLAFAVLYAFLYRSNLWAGWKDDLPVYSGAVQAFQDHADPYTKAYGGLLFVYPPVVLYAGSTLENVFGVHIWGIFFSLHVVCMLLTPLLLARYFLRDSWLTPMMAALVFLSESRFTGVMAIYSANVAPSLYFLALLAAVPGIRSNRWRWFYLVVLIAGLIKLTLVILLLLPVFAGTRQWLRSISCGAGVISGYAVQAKVVPALYAGYKSALLQQVSVRGLYGYGVFGVVASLDGRLHRHVGGDAYVAWACCAAAMLGGLFWLKSRRADALDTSTWLALLLMAVIIINPRMLAYDAYLGLFAAFYVFAIAMNIDRSKLIALMVVMFAPSLVVPYLLRTRSMHGSYELLLILIALAIGMRRLSKLRDSCVHAAGAVSVSAT